MWTYVSSNSDPIPPFTSRRENAATCCEQERNSDAQYSYRRPYRRRIWEDLEELILYLRYVRENELIKIQSTYSTINLRTIKCQPRLLTCPHSYIDFHKQNSYKAHILWFINLEFTIDVRIHLLYKFTLDETDQKEEQSVQWGNECK